MKTKARRSAPALDWLCDLSGKAARITSIGNQSLLVENHGGIAEFSGERILLATGCGNVEIIGEGLYLEELRRDALVIRGSIRDVHLPCAEVARHEP